LSAVDNTVSLPRFAGRLLRGIGHALAAWQTITARMACGAAAFRTKFWEEQPQT